AHRNFEGVFFEPISKMGDDVDLCCMGTTTFEHRYRSRALDRSLKEGGSTYKNRRVRRNDEDWPSLVVEAGNTEKSLPRLKADMRWWAESSKGNVHIVILLLVVDKANKKI